MTQDTAFTILTKSKDNVLLTGKPGAGKSYLTNKYIDWVLDNTSTTIEVCASTGIAALNIKGKTLHSFLGVRNDEVTEEDIKDIVENQFAVSRITAVDVLIIDEISMVSATLLDLADVICRYVRKDDRPFGGIRVIVVGDFFQLPPVKGEFAFNASVWDKADFAVCYLTEQHRSNDAVFNDILTGIRTGVITEEHKALLKSHIHEVLPDDIGVHVKLDTHNKRVDDFNEMRLGRLTTPAKTYIMQSYGTDAQVAMLKKMCQSPERLVLRQGARVIFTQNDKEQRWVNGTVGDVVAVRDGAVVVDVQGEEVTVEMTKWELANGYGSNKRVHAHIEQLPLRLAWAITIHKSQGMTLEKAVVDLSRVFECGQAYVAISRLRSLSGLYFQGILTDRILMVDREVMEFDKKLLEHGDAIPQ